MFPGFEAVDRVLGRSSPVSSASRSASPTHWTVAQEEPPGSDVPLAATSGSRDQWTRERERELLSSVVRDHLPDLNLTPSLEKRLNETRGHASRLPELREQAARVYQLLLGFELT